MLPLNLKLKKELHRKIAAAQDTAVRVIYRTFDKAVLHGGTAVWRCYKGNRFSEDIDMYIPGDLAKIEELFKSLAGEGFTIEKKKIGENSLYSTVLSNRVTLRIEALFRQYEGTLCDYETVDGNIMTVFSLTPEEFILEKIETYAKRLKIRDLYDVFFMLRHVADSEKVVSRLGVLLRGYRKPIDEAELKVLILEGLVPTSSQMAEYIQTWARKNTPK